MDGINSSKQLSAYFLIRRWMTQNGTALLLYWLDCLPIYLWEKNYSSLSFDVFTLIKNVSYVQVRVTQKVKCMLHQNWYSCLEFWLCHWLVYSFGIFSWHVRINWYKNITFKKDHEVKEVRLEYEDSKLNLTLKYRKILQPPFWTFPLFFGAAFAQNQRSRNGT